MLFQASARRVGLKKLLDWILSVMALSLVPWRLVIGEYNSPSSTLRHHYDFPSMDLNDQRTKIFTLWLWWWSRRLGRIGHEELIIIFKYWARTTIICIKRCPHRQNIHGDDGQVGLVGLVTENSGGGVLFSVGRVSRRPSSSSRYFFLINYFVIDITIIVIIIIIIIIINIIIIIIVLIWIMIVLIWIMIRISALGSPTFPPSSPSASSQWNLTRYNHHHHCHHKFTILSSSWSWSSSSWFFVIVTNTAIFIMIVNISCLPAPPKLAPSSSLLLLLSSLQPSPGASCDARAVHAGRAVRRQRGDLHLVDPEGRHRHPHPRLSNFRHSSGWPNFLQNSHFLAGIVNCNFYHNTSKSSLCFW